MLIRSFPHALPRKRILHPSVPCPSAAFFGFSATHMGAMDSRTLASNRELPPCRIRLPRQERVRPHDSDSCGQVEKLLGQFRPFAFILVFEEHEGVLPILGPHPLQPGLQGRLVVIGASQTQIAPIGGRHGRNHQLVILVGNAHCRPGSRSNPKTSSSNHDAWRNSAPPGIP